MKAMQQETYMILVAKLPSPQQQDNEELYDKAFLLREKIPEVSQSSIVTVDADMERKSINILKNAWELPDPRNQITYSDIFLLRTLTYNVKQFADGVKKYIELRSSPHNPFVIVASPAVLSGILDLIGISSHGVKWGISHSIVVVEIFSQEGNNKKDYEKKLVL